MEVGLGPPPGGVGVCEGRELTEVDVEVAWTCEAGPPPSQAVKMATTAARLTAMACRLFTI